MSGPKTSHYTLTPEQRRIIIEQRKIQSECALLIKQQKDVRSVVVQADKIVEQIAPLYQEIGADSGAVEQVKALCTEVMALLNRASQMGSESGLASLQETNQHIREVSRKLESLTHTLKKEFQTADRSFRTEMTQRISEGFGLSFDALGEDDNLQNNVFYQKIQAELGALSGFTISDMQKKRLHTIREKAKEIDDVDFLKNFYAMTVIPFAKECRSYGNAYAAYGEAYEQKRFIYETNANMLGIAAEAIPFSEDAVTILDAKIRETEEALQFRDEQAYISRCIDEAMQEMGYSVLGNREIVKRNGKRFRNELYLFDEGTAVNVTYSDDGQITMELGGMSTEDRIPTGLENTSLVSDMRTFCDDYYEIEKRLKKKGIVTKRISILPPDAQFAQIINVSDYNLCTDISEYRSQKGKRQTATNKAWKIGE